MTAWSMEQRLNRTSTAIRLLASCSLVVLGSGCDSTLQPSPSGEHVTASSFPLASAAVSATAVREPSSPPTSPSAAAVIRSAEVQLLFVQSGAPLPITAEDFVSRYNATAERPISASTFSIQDGPPDYSWLDGEHGIAITGLAHPDGSPRMLAVSFLNGLRPASGRVDERELEWNRAIRRFVEAVSPALGGDEADRLVIDLLGFTPRTLSPEGLIDYWSQPRRNTIVRAGVRYDLATTDDATHWLIATSSS